MAKSETQEALEEILGNPAVTTNEDGTRTVKLEEPVRFNNQDVTELTFRKPRGKDWRKTDGEKGDLAKGYKLAACLTAYPLSVFDDMTGDDALLCVGVATTMGKKLRTGETS